ncbi:MAG: outer membrane beta-barrel protein [Pseudomonadota bacterium]
MKNLIRLLPILTVAASPVIADESDHWFVRPYVGVSIMSGLSSDFNDIDSLSGRADIDLSDGFTGGIGIGYRYSEKIALEFGWEYRSNESSTTLADASEFDGGNYASNIFYFNGHYLLSPHYRWQPYLGAGLTWVEEVDIDLERNGEERSFSGDGDVGYQLFAGASYRLDQDWAIQGEVRFGRVSDIDLSPESGATGDFSGLDYETSTLQLGVVYNF